MPNRMLRDWTDSDKMKGVTAHGERFFIRLIMKVDDYGCLYADNSLLKAALFPFLLNEVREADISRWKAECQMAGLIVLYEVASKSYLQVQDFRQRLDKAKNKYPLPDSGNPITIGNDVPAEVEQKPNRTEESNAPVDLSKSNLFRKPKVPLWDDVLRVFIQQSGTEEMARAFFNTNGATEWYKQNNPITNFSSLVPNYIANWKKNEQRGQGGSKSDSSVAEQLKQARQKQNS